MPRDRFQSTSLHFYLKLLYVFLEFSYVQGIYSTASSFLLSSALAALDGGPHSLKRFFIGTFVVKSIKELLIFDLGILSCFWLGVTIG